MFLVRIKRNTGIPGSLGSIKIHVDDEQVATIKQNQNIEVELPTAEAKIAVSQAGTRSNELVVKEGQVVEITASLSYHIYLIAFVIGMFFVGLLLPDEYRLIGYAILIIMPFVINYFIEGYKLRVVYPWTILFNEFI